MSKTPVLIHIYDKKDTLEYRGRLLGAITDAEFEAIMKDNSLARKMLTLEAKGIKSLIDMKKQLAGHRLMFALKERESEVLFKTLLVSDTIRRFNYCTPTEDQVAFNFEGDKWMVIHED